MAEPFTLMVITAVGTLVLEHLFRWLRRQEQETVYWQRERALKAYRENHPA